METSGQTFWLILLTVGVIVLAGAIFYGIMRNRQRSPRERVQSEVATKQEYSREDRDAG